MKKYIYFISLCIFAFFAIISQSNAIATKRVLVEEFTGAWCQFCPDGAVKLDELEKQYPGKIIGVKFHNGDKMAIKETDTVGAALGLTGYPTGNVDRTVFNVGGTNKIMMDRGYWKSAAENVMNTAGIADISLQWSYNPTTNKITADISSKFDEAVSDEIRFNIYIVEDKCTGTGTGWDQVNYYNTVSGHPCYGLGNPIVGYVHDETVRALMGGCFGQANSIQGPVSAGSVSTYKFEMAKASSWNIDNIRLIGVVQYYSASDASKIKIMNAVEGTKVSSKTKMTVTGDQLFVSPVNNTNTVTIKLENTNTSVKEYTINLEKAAGTTWKASIEPNEYVISIPAAQSYTFTLNLEATSTGYGEANLTINEEDGMKFYVTNRGYSDDLDLVQVMLDPKNDAAGLGNLIKSFPEYDRLQNVSYSDFNQIYSKFTNLGLVVYNSGDEGFLSATENSVVMSLINKKVNLLFTGTQIFYSFNQYAQTISGMLGFRWNGVCFQGQSSGSINIAGISADPVSDGLSSQYNLIKYLLHKAAITDPSVCSKIITLQGNVDTVLAVKSQLTNSRAVCLGIQPMSISNTTQRNNLVYNALKWVFQTLPSNIPEIYTPTGISFGEVDVEKSLEKNLTIQNTGKADLEIDNINITNNDDGAFVIVDYGLSKIAPGASTDVIIKFAPSTTKFYNASTVEISSNDPLKKKAVVSLTGKGAPANSIQDLSNVNFNVSPNPVSLMGTVKFNIPDFAKSSNLSITDLNGKVVLNLGNNLQIGENSVQFDTDKFTSGNYFITLTVDGEIVTHKFTIVK